MHKLKRLVLVISILILTINTHVLANIEPLVNYSEVKRNPNNPYHILVNKENALDPTYVPDELVIPNVRFANYGDIEKNHMEKKAAEALENMFSAAKLENIDLIAISGYRSYERQKNLYYNAVRRLGIDQMSSAKGGHSEHQTGLAMDLNSLSQSFANTKEGLWLAENCYKFGFIIRYPEGKSEITGYIYEPWHIRYVGLELAEYCTLNNLALEEVAVLEQPEPSISDLRDAINYIRTHFKVK